MYMLQRHSEHILHTDALQGAIAEILHKMIANPKLLVASMGLKVAKTLFANDDATPKL
jgi:hypothetical protein